MTNTPPNFDTRTFAFACDIVRLYKALTNIHGFPIGIAKQILNAGTSIGANIEEGRAPSSRLRLIRATDLAPAKLTDALVSEADELVAILTVSVRNLRAG